LALSVPLRGSRRESPAAQFLVARRHDTPEQMSGNQQPKRKAMPDILFVITVAAVGILSRLVIDTYWPVMAVGVIVMIIAYVSWKLFRPFVAKRYPSSIKAGILIGWSAVALFGLGFVGLAFEVHHQMRGDLVIPGIVGTFGIWVAFQGIANVWRLAKKLPPPDDAA
jgi:MFS superfamily sulfate permease-like transporter